MNIKLRLTAMSFLQFFYLGVWLITIGNYWFGTKQWSGAHLSNFSTLGLSSIIMPALTGIIADKYKCRKTVMNFTYFRYFAFICRAIDPITLLCILMLPCYATCQPYFASNSVAYNILKQFRYCKSISTEFGYDRFYCCNVELTIPTETKLL
jgi:NHS family xanthosine MFS transporter